jgi:hypothetical protein
MTGIKNMGQLVAAAGVVEHTVATLTAMKDSQIQSSFLESSAGTAATSSFAAVFGAAVGTDESILLPRKALVMPTVAQCAKRPQGPTAWPKHLAWAKANLKAPKMRSCAGIITSFTIFFRRNIRAVGSAAANLLRDHNSICLGQHMSALYVLASTRTS